MGCEHRFAQPSPHAGDAVLLLVGSRGGGGRGSLTEHTCESHVWKQPVGSGTYLGGDAEADAARTTAAEGSGPSSYRRRSSASRSCASWPWCGETLCAASGLPSPGRILCTISRASLLMREEWLWKNRTKHEKHSGFWSSRIVTSAGGEESTQCLFLFVFVCFFFFFASIRWSQGARAP